MQNLFSMLLVAFMVVLGGIPSLYILISLPVSYTHLTLPTIEPV